MASDISYTAVILSLILTSLRTIHAERILASAPVSPVEEGSLLSIHCQVWDLKRQHKVFLLRETVTAGYESLSMGNIVQTSEDDRVFLAERHLGDGSIVYFLTIIDVTRQDEGRYTCKVMSPSLSDVIVEGSVEINVQYFPDEIFPICSPGNAPNVWLGQELTLNCSSETAFPRVNLAWSKSGVDVPHASNQVTRHGYSFSVLKFRPTLSDNGMIFVCTMSSSAFPETVQTCHVGPIRVEGGNQIGVFTPRPEIIKSSSAPSDDESNWNLETRTIATIPDRKTCNDFCPTYTNTFLYWVLATIATSFLALMLCIIGIVLLVKYRRATMDNRERTQQLSLQRQQQAIEDVYEKVDYRPGQPTLYMSLDKASIKLDARVLNSSTPASEHYRETPATCHSQYS